MVPTQKAITNPVGSPGTQQTMLQFKHTPSLKPEGASSLVVEVKGYGFGDMSPVWQHWCLRAHKLQTPLGSTSLKHSGLPRTVKSRSLIVETAV